MDLNKQFGQINNHGDEIYLNNGNIYLYLKAKDEERNIGRLFHRGSNGAISYHKSGLVDEKHLYRKCNGYGINDAILQKLPDDGIIVIDSDSGRYACKVKHARRKEVGYYYHYLAKGFELQKFIPKNNFKKLA
ncbi:MAG: hypothetical protein HRU18_01225 [Pseudoalteromonas sp.]|uniref:hypothetical protein n=1 Tax=Pseudoalteromonas sp. TaxID=53249 RepID=UPI001D6D90F4|nr:hypothetical protein [Pseudoalteromonas sp.]NRA76801.1 hypothetical protein [Pseudoalteromonas sp.]